MDEQSKGPNEVGYGRPPAEHQYPKGTSGHPGRKRGSKNKPKVPPGLNEAERLAWLESKRVIITGAGPMEAHQAVQRSQIATAGKGGTNAQKAYLGEMNRIAQKAEDAQQAQLEAYENYILTCEDILRFATPEQRRKLEEGLLPHPADIEVDFVKGEVRINGPANTLQKRLYAELRQGMEESRTRLLEIRSELEQDPENEELQYSFMVINNRYLTIWESLPERHRPDPLPVWGKSHEIPWARPKRRRRKLKKNAAIQDE